ncbi:MAG TPA: SDR family NAD(P)-dependent oxidoreductase [Myxococcaceae bacterium]|nr:SDR family NAD(P)-dependent oxidoreductase [Myxococcaceae bacterium]
MTARFAGKTVVVTGASRGLGRALALAFAGEGAWVLVGYQRRAEDAAATVRLLGESGGAGEAAAFDVTRPGEVQAALQKVADRRGELHVLVNNAGRLRDVPFALMTGEDWRDVLDTNLDGAFHCIRAALPALMKTRNAAVVNVASVSGLRASPGQASYAASKGGLLALTRTLAAELGPRGIRVNAVVPGMLDTGMAKHVDRRLVERYRAALPSGRLGTGEEVARAALFLASDDASYVFGQALVVDGGFSL